LTRKLPKLWLTSCLLISNLILIDQVLSQESGEGEITTPIIVTLLGTSAPTLDPEQSGMGEKGSNRFFQQVC